MEFKSARGIWQKIYTSNPSKIWSIRRIEIERVQLCASGNGLIKNRRKLSIPWIRRKPTSVEFNTYLPSSFPFQPHRKRSSNKTTLNGEHFSSTNGTRRRYIRADRVRVGGEQRIRCKTEDVNASWNLNEMSRKTKFKAKKGKVPI